MSEPRLRFAQLLPILHAPQIFLVVGRYAHFADTPYPLPEFADIFLTHFGSHEVLSVGLEPGGLYIRLSDQPLPPEHL